MCVPGLRGVPAVPSVHGLAAVHVLWLKQATRQTMQPGSIPLKPVGKPPPYPPPISSSAARTAHNESYPADLCAAVVLARIESSKKKKKEMEEKYEKEKTYEKEKKYAWRTEWKNKRWNKRIAWRYEEWQRRCQAVLLGVQETALVPSPAEGPSTASTAAFLPPQLKADK